MIYLTILLAYIAFTTIGIWWFLHRMGDKLDRDKRWWVKVLDAILITPLLPYFFILGLLNR